MLSWKSRFFLGVIVLGLSFIAGVHLYRMYQERLSQEETSPAGNTFHEVSVVAQDDPQPDVMALPWAFYGNKKEIYLEDVPLEVQEKREQARQTLRSILADYKDNEALKSFYADLRSSTGEELDLAALSGDQLPRLLEKYPQLKEVMAKHAQDPQFAAVLQEIFSNPQFAQSVMVLQAGQAR